MLPPLVLFGPRLDPFYLVFYIFQGYVPCTMTKLSSKHRVFPPRHDLPIPITHLSILVTSNSRNFIIRSRLVRLIAMVILSWYCYHLNHESSVFPAHNTYYLQHERPRCISTYKLEANSIYSRNIYIPDIQTPVCTSEANVANGL